MEQWGDLNWWLQVNGWLLPLGMAVGAFGTLIGAGGGFVLMPVLLLLYPKDSPDELTAISLAVVFFNALSGSAAYARMKRIDYKSGWQFALATIPGAVLGAITTAVLPRRTFDIIFGVLLMAASLFLLARKRTVAHDSTPEGHKLPFAAVTRTVTDAEGTTHTYTYNNAAALLASAAVGYLSSLLGIGGGIIHVPVLAQMLSFPVHVATATSHFVLSIMALAGTVVHVVTGAFQHGIRRTLLLSIGVIIGAQVGARLSNRVSDKWIIRSLAVALGFVGLRILVGALAG